MGFTAILHGHTVSVVVNKNSVKLLGLLIPDGPCDVPEVHPYVWKENGDASNQGQQAKKKWK